MKRIFVTILVFILSFSLLIFCSSCAPVAEESVVEESVAEESVEEPPEKPVIGVIILDATNHYQLYLKAAIEHFNEGQSELIFADGQFSQTVQDEVLDAFLKRGVDAIMIAMVEPEAAPGIIEKVRPYAIPLVFYNQGPTKEDIMLYDQAYYSASDSYEAGVMTAEMALDAYKANPNMDKNGDGIIQTVVVRGSPGHPDADLTTQGYLDFFEEQSEPTFEVLDNQIADWASGPAKEIMDAWLGRFGTEMELLVSNNDGMMLGSIESLMAAGWLEDDSDKQMFLIGRDVIPEMWGFIEDGTVYGSLLQSPVEEGRGAITIANNLLFDRDVEEGLLVPLGDMKDYRAPLTKVTIENLDVAKEMYELVLESAE